MFDEKVCVPRVCLVQSMCEEGKAEGRQEMVTFHQQTDLSSVRIPSVHALRAHFNRGMMLDSAAIPEA